MCPVGTADWFISSNPEVITTLRQICALQPCDLFIAEKAAHSAVFNQFCELIIRGWNDRVTP